MSYSNFIACWISTSRTRLEQYSRVRDQGYECSRPRFKAAYKETKNQLMNNISELLTTF